MTPSLLFLHGWGFAPAFWDRLRAALPDFRSEAVDLGYFDTPSDPELDGPVIAVGHSTGALLALREPRPECMGLVAINGFDHFVSLDGAPGVAPRLIDRMIARLPKEPATTVADFRRRCGDDAPFPQPDVERLAEHLVLLRNADERAASARWTLPLLHLSGAQDPILPAGLRANAFSGGARRTAAEHPEGGHLLPASHPDWCAAQIRAWAAA
jgi:pimeloyl-[acyl-carrier protein] methyl ester esterase